MDPVSHVALGRTLASLMAAAPPARRAVAAAVLFGALSPDLDAVVMPFGWDRYLRLHEIGTHSLPGTFLCAGLIAALVRWATPNAALSVLLLAAWTGAASHVLLDLLSSARIRVFWPVVDRQVSIPLVAMADPWLAGLLAASLPALWFAGAYRRRIATAALCAVAAFLAVKSVLAVQSLNVYRAAAAGDSVSHYILQARWASLVEWEIFDRTDSRLRLWRVAPAAPPALLLEWPLLPETSLIRTSRELSSVQNFLRAHDLAFAVTLPDAGNGRLVLWSDIRFCRRTTGGAARFEPTLISHSVRMSCRLWVGAEFDEAGRPRRQVVRIFGFTQMRPAGA